MREHRVASPSTSTRSLTKSPVSGTGLTRRHDRGLGAGLASDRSIAAAVTGLGPHGAALAPTRRVDGYKRGRGAVGRGACRRPCHPDRARRSASDEDGLWGVWAAEAPDAVVRARSAGDAIVLDGTKAWCSGAGLCTYALVTARLDDGRGGLFTVDLRGDAVQPLRSAWRNAGMAESDTRAVQFTDAPAIPVGQPDDYLNRPGFWFGAIGVAACWLGGARAVPPLYRPAADGGADDHHLAHLGAVDAALAAAESALAVAAVYVDEDPHNLSGSAELIAYVPVRSWRTPSTRCLSEPIAPSVRTAVFRRTARSRCRGPHRVCPAEPRRA